MYSLVLPLSCPGILRNYLKTFCHGFGHSERSEESATPNEILRCAQNDDKPFEMVSKSILGVRRFLLRGLEKVRTEWLWVCTAYNMRKLLAYVAGLRAELAKMLAETAS